ncbi:DNA-binding MarR family transcriptional regulator [Microbacteriaceae bacterium SG_E_30_P1]|uniref:DNA-binding MarR family transcriptional regulator n=1 Tax=Antiquaquibacter oligotrophicus TaxID=2880260 RepID=A0ABT6KR82_9MICO|nr:MarR family transcriptional regulator [Antiquaquibacter oligotrophicus]MDH6182336.1 DNA-binding MarR family transcriptional regulator [Antiquaquibacter oligotrophicus]UDF12011.1 MarR family transcriptional regulator [Antiquaquibacter oligotrophicus]
MVRKLDEAPAAPATVLLPYESEALADLVRISGLLNSLEFQRKIVGDSVIPDDPNAFSAIYALATAGSLRPGVLATKLHVSAPTASRLVEKLSCAGLVRRIADPDDSRASLVALTAEGAKAGADIFSKGDIMMDALLADWQPHDRIALTSLLSRLADAMLSDRR